MATMPAWLQASPTGWSLSIREQPEDPTHPNDRPPEEGVKDGAFLQPGNWHLSIRELNTSPRTLALLLQVTGICYEGHESFEEQLKTLLRQLEQTSMVECNLSYGTTRQVCRNPMQI